MNLLVPRRMGGAKALPQPRTGIDEREPEEEQKVTKRGGYRSVVSLVALVTFLVANNAAAAPIVVDFDHASDLDHFSQQHSGLSAISHNASAGIAGSGGIQVTGFNRATLANRSFNFSKSSDSAFVSLMFKALAAPVLPPQTSSAFAEIYLVPDPTGYPFSTASAFVTIQRVNLGNGLFDNIFGGPLQAGGGSFPGFDRKFPAGLIAAGRWYELQIGLTNQGTSIHWDILINDFGSEGMHLVENVLSLEETTPIGIQPLTGDSSIYAGFTITRDRVFDNLRLDTAPISIEVSEPGTLFLSALAAVLLMLAPKRRGPLAQTGAKALRWPT